VHDHFLLGIRHAGNVIDKIQRSFQAFGVRPVTAEQHPVDTDQFRHLVDGIFIEGRDENMFAETFNRVLGKGLGHFLVGVLEAIEQRLQPG